MPKTAERLKNAFPSLVLRSPVHRLLSGRYLILEFTGRRTGRRYRTPVAYVRDGEQVVISTDSPWWRNLSGGAPVRLWLAGREMEGTAVPVTAPASSAAVIRRLVDAIPSYARPAGLHREGGRVSDEEIERAVAEGRVAVEIRLASTP